MKEIHITEINNANKIKIIALYRDFTGVGLTEAKQAIETLPLSVQSENEPALDDLRGKLVELGCVVTGVPSFSVNSLSNEALRVTPTKDTGLASLESVSQLPEKFRPPVEITKLNRDETIELLSEIKKTCGTLCQLYNRLNSLTSTLDKETQTAEKMRKLPDSYIYIGLAGGVIGFIGGFIIGAIIGLFIGIIVTSLIYNTPKKKKEREDKADKYIEEKVVPIQNEIKVVDEELEKLNATGKIDWAIGIVGEELFNIQDIRGLAELIKTGRADNLKEALNLYDDVMHRKRMEAMQRDVVVATEISATEAIKQTQQMQAQSQQLRQQSQQLQEISRNTKAAVAAAKKAGTTKVNVRQKVDIKFK